MSIKNLKPRRSKRGFKQGYFDSANPTKYKGPRPIIYRSSYEYRFMLYCERERRIIEWSSEPFAIQYASPSGKAHKYWIDFVIKYDDDTIWLIEVKPYSQTIPQNNATFKKNAAKWTAAKQYCESREKYQFSIVTEKTLSRLHI